MTLLFSAEDSDLAKHKACLLPRSWRGEPQRLLSHYPRIGTRKLASRYPHRIVAQRMIGRIITRGEEVDHINHDVCDCRRENLRVVSRQENSQNRNPERFPYRGTTWHKSSHRWQAQVETRQDGIRKVFYLGLFDSREDAAIAATQKRKELNFCGAISP